MTVADLAAALECLAPLCHAESWDNVGLIVGDPAAPAARVLFCIDLTLPVLAEAASLRCDAVVAYHPPIFEGLKRLRAGDVAFEAARRGIAVYAPHTALDVADGGTNDVLADLAGMSADRRPLRASEGRSTTCKLVTFAPPDAAEKVAEALFAAGAGRIGAYEKCSFRSEGEGTFLGGESSNPAIGKAGTFERTREIKIETIVPLAKVEAIIAALRATHPYETPAFDLVTLAAAPEGMGIGRVGNIGPTTPETLASRIKRRLALDAVLLSGPAAQPIQRLAICAGAGRSLLPDLLASGAQAYLTGELPHHDVLRLQRAGIAVICTLHSNSERPALWKLSEKLSASGFECVVSEVDRDPLRMF